MTSSEYFPLFFIFFVWAICECDINSSHRTLIQSERVPNFNELLLASQNSTMRMREY